MISRTPWTNEDDQRLIEQLLRGIPVDQVAKNIGRTRSAILSRAPLLRIKLNGPDGRPILKPMEHLLRRQVDPGLKAKSKS